MAQSRELRNQSQVSIHSKAINALPTLNLLLPSHEAPELEVVLALRTILGSVRPYSRLQV